MGIEAVPVAVLWLGLIVVVLLGLLLGGLVWARRAHRRARVAWEGERARHDATRRELRRAEELDLAALRLAGARSPSEVADLAGEAASTLLGAHETVLVLQAADDLLVTRTAAPHRLEEDAAHELAKRALERRVTLREPADGGTGTPSSDHVLLATPLRDGEHLLGALVMLTVDGVMRTAPAEVATAERLAAHVARAVVRMTGGRMAAGTGIAARPGPVSGLERTSDTRPGDPAVPVPEAPPQVITDLGALVRSVAADARTSAAAAGTERRVAVLAPPRAGTPLPREQVESLVRGAFDLVLDATEPGSNLAVELLAMEDGWELVLAHAGAAVDQEALAASPLPAIVSALGGALDAGEGAGVARLRVRLHDEGALHGAVEWPQVSVVAGSQPVH